MPDSPDKSMDEVIREDGRYPIDAFGFLHDGLTRAVQETHGDQAGPTGQRHVSGQQLCCALRDLAVERWGLLAKTVLARWNIRRTLDFGNMVYLLVNNDFMRKTEEDSIDDFVDVYDFTEAFRRHGEFELKE